jgi:hypothetical protein
MRYWSLLGKPSLFRVRESVLHQDMCWWLHGRSAVRPGDRVIIWQALDRRTDRRGVVGFGEVIDGPREVLDRNPYWVDPASGASPASKVLVRYVRPKKLPIWFDRNGDPLLDRLKVSRGQGTVFKEEPDAWEAVLEAAGGWPDQP